MPLNRRLFVAGAAAAAAHVTIPSLAGGQTLHSAHTFHNLPFRIAVINDEISDDFDHACRVAAVDLDLQFIELRSLWGKNVTVLTDAEITEARKILSKYNLAVTDIASPLFKTRFPAGDVAGGPTVDQFGAASVYNEQAQVLEQCIHLARSFNTIRIRGFDYERIVNPRPYLPEIREHLRKAARRMAKENLIFLLENEQTCNTATGAEAAETLAAVQESNFMLNWDPGNAASVGEPPFPNGYDLLPKNRIGHCHCKDVLRGADGKPAWAAVGTGIVDWRGQIAALINQRFSHTLSLETHWRGAGTAEASTRQSMAGLKEVLDEFSS